MAHVAMDMDANLEYGVESIEMHLPLSLTFKYGSRVLLATYTAIILVCIAS